MKSHKQLPKLPQNQISPILYLLYRKGVLNEKELSEMAAVENTTYVGFDKVMDRIDEITEGEG